MSLKLFNNFHNTSYPHENHPNEAFADSEYVGQEETLQKYGLKDEICEKGYRGNPLTDEQREGIARNP